MESPLFIQQIFTVPGTGREQRSVPGAHDGETSDKIKHTRGFALWTELLSFITLLSLEERIKEAVGMQRSDGIWAL